MEAGVGGGEDGRGVAAGGERRRDPADAAGDGGAPPVRVGGVAGVAEHRRGAEEKAALQGENAALRVELDHVLRAKPRWHHDDDDAESCCYGDNFTDDTGGKEEDEGGGGVSTVARCFGCGERACCWHLCASCAAAAWACPACGYSNMDMDDACMV